MYSVFDASETFYKVNKSVQELAPLVAKHGIKAINPPKEVLEDVKAAREAAKCAYDNGLKWGLLPMPVDFFSPDVTDEAFDAALEKLKVWAESGQRMGVKNAYNHVFPGSNEKEYDENFTWHAIRLSQINRVLSAHGIRYGLEFLAPWDLRKLFKHPFTHTIAGVLAIADSVSCDIGVVFDTYHWYTGGYNPDDLFYAAQHVDRMVGFHINDGVEGRPLEEQEDMTRAMPMTTGIIDAIKPYKLFISKGYTGPVVIEPMFPTYKRFMHIDAEDVVKEIAACYKRMEELAKR